jgi:hypothetical protein
MEVYSMIHLTQFNAAEILTPAIWAAITSYMDDAIREDVHGDLAPCTEYDFLAAYVSHDPTFSDLLQVEFSIII